MVERNANGERFGLAFQTDDMLAYHFVITSWVMRFKNVKNKMSLHIFYVETLTYVVVSTEH